MVYLYHPYVFFIYVMFVMQKKWKEILLNLLDIVSFLVFILWLVLFVKFFVVNPFTVVWSSMEPTFSEKDFIFVDKISNKFGTMKRWDIIVFVASWKSEPYIKRIIWLPWEIVKIKDWWVLICWTSKDSICDKLDENYLPKWLKTEATCWQSEFEVKNWYFVMWDNRWFSTDSSCCFWLGCYSWANYTVTKKDIIWKVYLRLFPHFKVF